MAELLFLPTRTARITSTTPLRVCYGCDAAIKDNCYSLFMPREYRCDADVEVSSDLPAGVAAYVHDAHIFASPVAFASMSVTPMANEDDDDWDVVDWCIASAVILTVLVVLVVTCRCSCGDASPPPPCRQWYYNTRRHAVGVQPRRTDAADVPCVASHTDVHCGIGTPLAMSMQEYSDASWTRVRRRKSSVC